MTDFSVRFKQIMAERGLKAADLAVLMGYTPQYISDLFSGKRRWNETTISKACESLGLKLHFSEEDSSN